MKLTGKITVISAALVMAGVCAFAQTSNTNTATEGLIEDGAIDNITKNASGIANSKGIIFGGYDQNGSASFNFEAGYGMWITNNIWAGAYYNGRIKNSQTKTESATNTETASDGVNVSGTTTSTETALSDGGNNYINNARILLAFNKKIGAAVFYDGNVTGYYNNLKFAAGKSVESSADSKDASASDSAAGTSSSTKYTTKANYKDGSSYGVDLYGVKTPDLFGKLKFFAQLDTVKLTVSGTYMEGSVEHSASLNGSAVGAAASYSGSGIFSTLVFEPKISGEAGITLPKFGLLTADIVVLDDFSLGIPAKKNTSTYTEVTKTASANTTTKTDYEVTFGKEYSVYNTVTPRINFGFDFGDRLTVKARAEAAVYTSHSYDGADSSKKTVNTATETIGSGTATTNTVTTASVDANGGQNADTVVTSVTPACKIGVSYAVVPGKFNVNFGTKLCPSTYTWTTTTKTNAYIATESRTDSTTAAGETTTTAYSKTVEGNGTTETKTTEYTAASVANAFSFGATWFLTPNLDLDILVNTDIGEFSINNIITKATFGIQLAVKF